MNRDRSPPFISSRSRKMSDPDIHHNIADILSSSGNDFYDQSIQFYLFSN